MSLPDGGGDAGCDVSIAMPPTTSSHSFVREQPDAPEDPDDPLLDAARRQTPEEPYWNEMKRNPPKRK